MDGVKLFEGNDGLGGRVAGDPAVGAGIPLAGESKYLIQHRPVPGIPAEIYLRPVGETPYRNPGTPQLQPIPRLESVALNGPLTKVLRNLQPIQNLLPYSFS